MFVNVTITVIIVVVCMILLHDFTLFLHDRTTFGNIVFGTAVGLILLMFVTAIWQLWN